MKGTIRLFVIAVSLMFPFASAAEEGRALDKALINPSDQASLQRGARLYFNYCAGCHSMKYMRYNRLAKDIGIRDGKGEVVLDLLKKSFIFSHDKAGDTIRIAMSESDAKKWFGVVPPDLTLIARIRGVDWLYTYLRSFYSDPSRPWGTNNLIFSDVAMPNVLLPLQGDQIPFYRTEERQVNGVKQRFEVIDHVVLLENGMMSPQQFDVSMTDLVNFLSYAGEPSKQERQRLGIGVLLFLSVFAGLLYLLKKEYWKSV